MKELTIILVEDDPSICKIFAEIIEESDDMALLSITNSATKALEDIKDFLPNVVILDLELHHGSGSGLDVLKGMKDTVNIDLKPYTLITTNNISAITYDCARALGADYIFSKYQDNYSEENVIDFLRIMKPSILSKQLNIQSRRKAEDTPDIRKKRIRRRLINEFNLVGLSPRSIGYNYLIEAVELIIEKPRQNIPTLIGNMHDKTAFSVERAMQNTIKRAWKTADTEQLFKQYTAKISPEKGFPTITEFVYYYAYKIKNEYE